MQYAFFFGVGLYNKDSNNEGNVNDRFCPPQRVQYKLQFIKQFDIGCLDALWFKKKTHTQHSRRALRR